MSRSPALEFDSAMEHRKDQQYPRPGGTREALMLSALEEFASRGIAGTSIARLVKRSGAKNSSALHYHFGSKDGLVESLIVFIQAWFDHAREPGLCRIEDAIEAGKPIDLRAVLAEIVTPYSELIEQEPWGLAAVRFIAMIEFDENLGAWKSLVETTSSSAQRLLKLLLAVTPHLEEGECTLRLTFFIDSIVYGFSAHQHLSVSFFGDQASTPQALREFYIDCGERMLA